MKGPFPAELGYRMPPEWAPHQAVWVSWPHKRESWPGNFAPVPAVMAKAVAALSVSELVRINVNDEAMAGEVKALLSAEGVDEDRYTIHPFPTNDAWCRDHGAIFVVREKGGKRQLAATRWGYNAWGGKYGPWDKDEQIPRRMARELHVPLFDGEMILEGGSIDVDGEGLLLTTEQCLLNDNRNPDLSQAQIEERLKSYLGVEKILWLGEGIVGDDTDGHIDDITRFVAPGTVVTAVEDDPEDENYAILQENLERLRKMTRPDGRPLEIISLPMPGRVEFEGERLPASYANFYIGNKVVLVPTYRHPNDERAIELLRKIFPKRRIVGVDSTEMILGLGSFHCLTQQVPAADP